jgi:hypothetical protein
MKHPGHTYGAFVPAISERGMTGHVVDSGASNVDALFFKLRWDRYGFDKKCTRTCYAELVFLHPVGSTGHVVLSGAIGAGNIDTLFFMLGFDWYGFDKKHADTRYAKLVFLHPMGSTGDEVHFSSSRE